MELPSPSAAPPDRLVDLVESPIDPNRHVLTPVEVRADPILYNMAKQQGLTTTPRPASKQGNGPSFKARPAPDTSMNAGPKMTKSAALRQGLTWEDKGKRARPGTADGSVVKAFGDVPGHKRNNLSMNIKSLAAPIVAPRPTKSSQLRTGVDASSPVVSKRDPAVIAAEMKLRAEQEKLRRRASIAIPASLSAPLIAPRTNRSSELRSGGAMRPPPVSFRSQSALTTTTAPNVPPPPVDAEIVDAKAARRASVIGTVKSLGQPSIAPRLNKAAMLRNPGATTSGVPSSIVTSDKASVVRPKLISAPASTSIGSKSVPSQSALAAVRPTKSSLLRARLGAKVQTR